MVTSSEYRIMEKTMVQQTMVKIGCIVGMILIYLYQPQLVQAAQRLLLGAGFVPEEFSASVLKKYFQYGLWSIVFSAIAMEISGFLLVARFRHRNGKYVEFEARIARQAKAAGMRVPKLLVVPSKSKILNAAATVSLLTGPKIMIVGDIVEKLTEIEEEYVIAHELEHIRNRDIFFLFFVRAGGVGVSIQKWTILLAACYQLVASGWHHFAYLGSTWLLLAFTHTLYKLCAVTLSRSFEYLADAGAVRTIGWKNREHLIIGIMRVQHAMTGLPSIHILGLPDSWLQSHPTSLKRAYAIGLEPAFMSDGRILLDDTVIPARFV